MNKQEYLARLRAALACLPEGEIEESVAFYTEMIDDRVADGLTEEEATAQLDDPKAAARAIIADLPVVPRTVVLTKQRNRALYWTLVILGFPLWFPLLLGAGMLVLAGLLTIWCLILGLWLLAAGLLAGGPLGIGVCLWRWLWVSQPMVCSSWDRAFSASVWGCSACTGPWPPARRSCKCRASGSRRPRRPL